MTTMTREEQASTEANAIFSQMAQADPTIRALLRGIRGPSWRYYGPSWNKLKHNDHLYVYSTTKVTHAGRIGFGSWVYRVQGSKLVMMSNRRIHRLRKDAKARAKTLWGKAAGLGHPPR